MAATSVLVKSAKLWNNLDIDCKYITTRKNFRAKINADTINILSNGKLLMCNYLDLAHKSMLD